MAKYRIDMYLIVYTRVETGLWTRLKKRVPENVPIDTFLAKKRRKRKGKDETE